MVGVDVRLDGERRVEVDLVHGDQPEVGEDRHDAVRPLEALAFAGPAHNSPHERE